jgi:hypothetical protein
VQAAGNHQVQHQPEIALHSDGYSLADLPQFTHNTAFGLRNWWFRGTKQKRICQPYLLDRLRDDP